MKKSIETPKVLTNAEFEAKTIRDTFAGTAAKALVSRNKLRGKGFDHDQITTLLRGEKINGINMNDVFRHVAAKV